MKPAAIAVVSFLAGSLGGTLCVLYFAHHTYERGLDEFEEALEISASDAMDDIESNVRFNYSPLRAYAQGNLAALVQWHCSLLGMNLRALKPNSLLDPDRRQRAERLKSDASALLARLEQDGTCSGPGGADVASAQ